MSLESAKKQGFIASMINIIMPIATAAMLGMFYYQIILSLINNQSETAFWTGAITGFFIVTSAVSIIGFVLFFVSMYKLSNYYKEPKIFKNVLYGLLISIICGIIIGIIATAFFISQASSFISTTPNSNDIVSHSNYLLSIFAGLIAIIGISVIFAIINGVFYWQAFNKLGEKSGVDAFKTTGTLYLIGSILTLIGIGAILQWIAWIFAADGYRKIQPQPTTNNTTTTESSSVISGKIYCSYCGIENDADNSTYCK